jgi:alkylhydroperoxidase family enzyme
VSNAIPVRVRTLIDKFLGDRGTTPLELRKAVFDRAHAFGSGATSQPPVAQDLASWVDMIAANASAATDADLARLVAAGYTEDDIIEVTEAAALGASLARLEIAYRITGSG